MFGVNVQDIHCQFTKTLDSIFEEAEMVWFVNLECAEYKFVDYGTVTMEQTESFVRLTDDVRKNIACSCQKASFLAQKIKNLGWFFDTLTCRSDYR